ARLQPRHPTHVLVVAVVGVVVSPRGESQRDPQLRLVRPIERGTHYAYHAIGLRVQQQGAAHDIRIGAKALLPYAIRKHRFLRGAGLVFFRGEDPSEVRTDLEDVEVAGGDFGAVQQFRIRVFAAEVETGGLQGGCGREDVLAI